MPESDSAQETLTASLLSKAPGDPSLADVMAELAKLLYRPFSMDNVADLERFLKLNLGAADGTIASHPDLTRRMSILAFAYKEHFRVLQDLADLDTAIDCALIVADRTSPDHDFCVDRQLMVVRLCKWRYDRLHNPDDLDLVVRFRQLAVDSTPLGHAEFLERKLRLAETYAERYRMRNRAGDLDMVLKYMPEVEQGLPRDHLVLGHVQSKLGGFYHMRFEAQFALDDLDHSIEYSLLAVENTPRANSQVLANRQQTLSLSLINRYERLGNIKDLDMAVKYGELSLANASDEDVGTAEKIQNLAGLHLIRFQRFKDPEDLNITIHYMQLASDMFSSEPAVLSTSYQSLATVYVIKHNEFHLAEDMELASKYAQLASASFSGSEVRDKSKQYQNIAAFYINRFEKLGDKSDLEKAIEYNHKAIENSLPLDHMLPVRWQNLANAYYQKHQIFNNISDLQKAIELYHNAINNTPENHPLLSYMQQGLAKAYISQFNLLQDLADFKTAILLLHQSTLASAAPPSSIWSAAKFLTFAPERMITSMMVEILTNAFAIVPDLLWLGSSISTRHSLLVEENISDITSVAAVIAIHSDNLPKAVEFLEAGLAIMHKQSIQLKTNYENLKNTMPEQAHELENVSQQLLLIQQGQSMSGNSDMLTVRRNDILASIRQTAGFERFLLPPSCTDLFKAAENGPIIILTCSGSHAFAIVVLLQMEKMHSIRLENVNMEKLQKMQMELRIALKTYAIHSRDVDINRYGRPHHSGPRVAQESLYRVLNWVWTCIVKPVLVQQYDIMEDRIWWCPSGPFSCLPIHAAAPVESKVISSYTFTLEGLIQARERRGQFSSTSTSAGETIAVIGLTAAPNLPRLPSVEDEINQVMTILEPSAHSVQRLVDSDATVENVTEAIKSAEWLHFACHGHQDGSDAMNSGLELFDGRLTLRELSKIHTPQAKFAFLSACETATGDNKLVNEAMHLAGAFVANGCQGAIGTLWSIPDAYGPKIARAVYERIFGGGRAPDVMAAAEGLHIAIQELRKQNAPLHQWMPFIHVGI